MSGHPDGDRPALPQAVVGRERGGGWALLLPLLAVLLAGYFGWRALTGRGLVVTVRAGDGHGIKAGDALRHRGIRVGEVRRVALSPSADEVVITVELHPGTEALAREGSLFWVVRPEVSLEEITGLETLIGARYLAVRPGPADAPRRTEFIAAAQAPLLDASDGGGLEIVLEAEDRWGIARGAPLLYRHIRVGTVLSVGLSSDSTSVEVRAYIEPAYVALVRDNTRFWEVSGVGLDIGLTGGVSLELESLPALLVGGISMATPTNPGTPVRTGHRFRLVADPDEEWRSWRPPIPLGNELLPPESRVPRPLRATLSWRSAGIFHRRRQRSGWLLALEDGLVGPADLLDPQGASDRSEVVLEVAGREFSLAESVLARGGGLVRVRSQILDVDPWPRAATRPLVEVESCLLVADPAQPPLALAPSRLLPGEAGGWEVDRAVTLGEGWHGAAVIARSDGALVGALLVDRGGARIAPLP